MNEKNDKQKLLFIIMQMQNRIFNIDPDLIDNSDIDDLFQYVIFKLDELGGIIHTMEN